ncbi:MAG: hypothetical protein QM781_04835 [Chitinophagaceae bacterium]
MIKIVLPEFVGIKMEEISREERHPSFQAEATIELTTFSGQKTIHFNSLWFDNKSWNEFVSQLGKAEQPGNTILTDMSQGLKIEITWDNQHIYFCLSGNERFTNDEFEFKYKRRIDKDDLGLIAAAFKGAKILFAE